MESNKPSSSAIAPPTVDAEVPIATAVMVPSSASISLIAEATSVPVVVRVDTSPTESNN